MYSLAILLRTKIEKANMPGDIIVNGICSSKIEDIESYNKFLSVKNFNISILHDSPSMHIMHWSRAAKEYKFNLNCIKYVTRKDRFPGIKYEIYISSRISDFLCSGICTSEKLDKESCFHFRYSSLSRLYEILDLLEYICHYFNKGILSMFCLSEYNETIDLLYIVSTQREDFTKSVASSNISFVKGAIKHSLNQYYYGLENIENSLRFKKYVSS